MTYQYRIGDVGAPVPKLPRRQTRTSGSGAFSDLFAKESFKDALKRTFVAAGQASGTDGNFKVYKTHARNSIAAELLPEGKAPARWRTGYRLATIVGDADVAACDDDDEPETDDEEIQEADE